MVGSNELPGPAGARRRLSQPRSSPGGAVLRRVHLGRVLGVTAVTDAPSVVLGTIYLVDLVGSTRLAVSVGPVRADELREEFFGLLREAIAASGGNEVKGTGDGLMVAFSSASAAVGCAELTQQLFERRYRGAEQQLHVRIGLGTGESVIEDGDYYGCRRSRRRGCAIRRRRTGSSSPPPRGCWPAGSTARG